MRRYLVFLLAILMGGLLSLSVIYAQDDAVDYVQFDVDNENPMVLNGRAYAEWDGRHTVPATVFHYDGQFHMFRAGYSGWPLPASVGYMVSDDGINWEEPQEEAVIYPEDIPIEGIQLAVLSSGFVESDGTWVLYLFLISENNDPSGMIRATAPDPLGPWEVGGDILLATGNDDAWDWEYISAPHVMMVEDGYRAYYFSGGMIGMATSPDGINWTKYDDPSTTDAPFAESDPIFLPSEDEEAWDYDFIQDPTVLQTPDGWVMLYSSFQGVNASFNGGERGYGIAISEDGIAWERLQDEPIWHNRRDMRVSRDTWYGQLAYHDETYYLYLEVTTGYGTDIIGGTYEGLFLDTLSRILSLNSDNTLQ